MRITDFSVYMFDLDGTIINSEYAHYQAYCKSLSVELSYSEYQRIFHSDIKDTYLSSYIYDKKYKEEMFTKLYKAEYVNGFEDLFKRLLLLGKTVIIVTNSSLERVEFIKQLHPLLRKVDKWYCNEGILQQKPHSDKYIKAITECGVKLDQIIIFEDSYTGYCSIKDIPVQKIFLCDPAYYYYTQMIGDRYASYDTIQSINAIDTPIKNHVEDKLNNYLSEINRHKDSIGESVILVYNLLKTKVNTNNIYFLGIGKCGHICKKIVSTWSSIGIRAYHKSVEDLLHGEFATFKKGDIVFFVSNSGNTEELVRCAKHCRNFSVIKVALVFQDKSELKQYMDIYLPIGQGIKESCHLNSAPTTSSVLFMILLDSLGTLISEHIISLTKQQFKLYHPGGSLGIVKPINTVVICACGKGTRLLPLTQNIPKFLVNIDTFNILTHMIQYWKDYTYTFEIIIQKRYNQITSFYLDKLDIKYCIHNIELQDQENAYTLYNALKDTRILNRVLITWCDLFPSSPLSHNAFTGTTIFTNGNKSRYSCAAGSINKQEGGNVVGIYYFDTFVHMMYENEKQDICDIIPKYYSEIRSFDIPTLHDVGDMDKLLTYQQLYSDIHSSRYFNRITPINNDTIKKESICKEGTLLIKREIKYYSAIEDFNLPFPSVHSADEESFIMERCNGTLAKLLDPSAFLKPLLLSLQSIHSTTTRTVTREQFEKDLTIEFKTKIMDRISKIQPLLDHFNHVTHVNGIQLCLDVSGIVDSLFQQILDSIREMSYVIIHGDPNFSNVFVDSSGIKFIDPRGYYGSSFLFGYKYYDYSKILYALSGYDTFNDAINYHLVINEGNLTLNIPTEKLETYKKYFIEQGIDWDTCKRMCVIHWLGLTNYISNDIQKSVGAYYTALYLYKSIL